MRQRADGQQSAPRRHKKDCWRGRGRGHGRAQGGSRDAERLPRSAGAGRGCCGRGWRAGSPPPEGQHCGQYWGSGLVCWRGARCSLGGWQPWAQRFGGVSMGQGSTCPPVPNARAPARQTPADPRSPHWAACTLVVSRVTAVAGSPTCCTWRSTSAFVGAAIAPASVSTRVRASRASKGWMLRTAEQAARAQPVDKKNFAAAD